MRLEDITLVLDLDGTLVSSMHAQDNEFFRSIFPSPDLKIMGNKVWVYKRPYLDEFIEYCKVFKHVGVWIAASREYAEELASALFANRINLSFLMCNEDCQIVKKEIMETFVYIKDLNVL